MPFKTIIAGLVILLATGCSPEPVTDRQPTVSKNFTVTISPRNSGLKALDVKVMGRVIKHKADHNRTLYEQQWPGTYIEGAFKGERVYFTVESPKMSLAISVDNQPVHKMIDVAPGQYVISQLANESHVVRIQVVSENQNEPSRFGGVLIEQTSTALSPPKRDVQFEFIGDSHTVGYANTSDKRDCSNEDVFNTTDTSLGVAGKLSKIYQADYQVNAISGRGIVRNYDGGDGTTIPTQYPFTLLSQSQDYNFDHWSPELIVTSIGTNDFSTELKEDEPWKSREDLRADYEAQYFDFLKEVMARYPESFIIIWVAAEATAEKFQAAVSVVNQIKEKTNVQIGFVPINGLAFNACHWHPDIHDAEIIADGLDKFIRANNLLPR